jgi:hypothetical protein
MLALITVMSLSRDIGQIYIAIRGITIPATHQGDGFCVVSFIDAAGVHPEIL